MLTDQGEFLADWGRVFELKKGHEKGNSWDLTKQAYLLKKNLAATVLTINLLQTQNWGQ